MRVYEHGVVGESDVARADGNQSAGRVRAPLWTPGHEGAARRADAAGRERARFDSVGSQRPPARARCSRQSASHGIPRQRSGIERRIQQTETKNASDVTAIDAPIGVPQAYADHVSVLFDLIAVAYQAE